MLDLPALRRLCTHAPKLRRLLGLALENLRIDGWRASQALADGDLSRFGKCMHRLEGAVCVLCAKRSPILECFQRVQLAQASGDLSQTRHEAQALDRQLQKLQQELQRALDDLAA